MSVYLIKRLKFEGGNPCSGQEKVVEVCSTQEIANAVAKVLTRDIWETYGDRAGVERGTAVTSTPSCCYKAVIRLRETDIRGTTIRVSKCNFRTTLPPLENDAAEEEEVEAEGAAADPHNSPDVAPAANGAVNVTAEEVQSLDATNCLAGCEFLLHGLQQPLNALQIGQLIRKHGASCVMLTRQTPIHATSYAVVAANPNQHLLDELTRLNLQSYTQEQLFSTIKDSSTRQREIAETLPQQILQPIFQQFLQPFAQQAQIYSAQQLQNPPAQMQIVAQPPRPQSPIPPVPYWIIQEVAKLRSQFPDDRFDCMMERSFYPEQYPRYGLSLCDRPPSPTDGFVAKIFCLDCPDQRSYQVGIGKLANFRMHHLEKPLHRDRVEARMWAEKPMDEVQEHTIRAQQLVASRHW